MPRFMGNSVWASSLGAAVCSVILLATAPHGLKAEERSGTGTSFRDAADRSRSSVATDRTEVEPTDLALQGERTAGVSTELRKLQTIQRGSSSKAVRETAVANLPLDQLADEQRDRVERILEAESLYRRLPTLLVPVDHRAYRYFAEHPDVAVSIWRVMKISKCQMRQSSPNLYEMEVGDGSAGVVEVLFRTAQQALVMCDGVFSGPLMVKPYSAKALIHLQSHLAQSADGEPYVAHTADLFVSFNSQTVETAAKFISPLSNLIIDRNFSQISMFLQMMSQAMSKQPGWVEQVADRMEGVAPERRQELLKVSARVYVSERKRELLKADVSKPISVDEIMAPLREANIRPASFIASDSRAAASAPTGQTDSLGPQPRIASGDNAKTSGM